MQEKKGANALRCVHAPAINYYLPTLLSTLLDLPVVNHPMQLCLTKSLEQRFYSGIMDLRAGKYMGTYCGIYVLRDYPSKEEKGCVQELQPYVELRGIEGASTKCLARLIGGFYCIALLELWL